MKLEDQVCSLELAKRMKKLGVKQESLYWWCVCDGDWKLGQIGGVPERHHAAFTVADLGEMLPKSIQFDGFNSPHIIFSHKEAYGYVCTLHCFLEGGLRPIKTEKGIEFLHSPIKEPPKEINQNGYNLFFREETEADARAKMLIHLIEKGIVKP